MIDLLERAIVIVAVGLSAMFVLWMWRSRPSHHVDISIPASWISSEEDLMAKLELLARHHERQLCADEAYRAVLKHNTVQLAEYVKKRVLERG